MIPELKFFYLSAFCHRPDQSLHDFCAQQIVWMMSSRVSDLHQDCQTFETYLTKLISVRYLVYNNSLKTFQR